MKYTALINDKSYAIEIGTNNTVLVNGDAHSVDFRSIDGTLLYSLLMDNASWEVLVERTGLRHLIPEIGLRQRRLARHPAKRCVEAHSRHAGAPD